MTHFGDVRVLFFGRLGEIVGREVRLDSSQRHCTIAEVKDLLAVRYPQATAELTSPRLRACIDDVVVDDSSAIDCAMEIAFLPPLSGG